MSTDLLTLTTEELCNQCEEATGYRPSIHQLGDWVTKGFLPESQAGRGRGRRIGGTDPRRWNAECLPRLIVIVGSRTGDKRKYISATRAALALAIAGFPDKKYLKVALKEYLAELNAHFLWHKGLKGPKSGTSPSLMSRELFFARLSPTQRSARFRKAAERRNDEFPLPLRTPIMGATAAMRGASASDATEPWSQFGKYISLSGFQTALDAANEDDMVIAYEQASLLLQGLEWELAHFLLLLDAALVTSVTGAAPAYDGREALREIASLFLPRNMAESGPTLVSALRLLGTLIILIANQQGESLVQLGDQAVQPLLEMLSSFSKKTGGSKQAVSE